MSENISHKLVIAISSRALFDLDAANQIYEAQGEEAYSKYQIQRENEILAPGVAFSLVTKLLNLGSDLVEVVLVSRNTADTGLRVFNSIQHYGLKITRAAFTRGQAPYPYLRAFAADLFLSANPNDVCRALNEGSAAATILTRSTKAADSSQNELRIAFDGDAVLFSDASERIFQELGIDAFTKNEAEQAHRPLETGPFHGFLTALHRLQQQFDENNCPIRTALVTARQAPAHKRVIHTLRDWHIRIDEAIFLGGLSKGEFLKAFGADIFFDDQQNNCASANEHVTTGHVPSGIKNKKT